MIVICLGLRTTQWIWDYAWQYPYSPCSRGKRFKTYGYGWNFWSLRCPLNRGLENRNKLQEEYSSSCVERIFHFWHYAWKRAFESYSYGQRHLWQWWLWRLVLCKPQRLKRSNEAWLLVRLNWWKWIELIG